MFTFQIKLFIFQLNNQPITITALKLFPLNMELLFKVRSKNYIPVSGVSEVLFPLSQALRNTLRGLNITTLPLYEYIYDFQMCIQKP